MQLSSNGWASAVNLTINPYLEDALYFVVALRNKKTHLKCMWCSVYLYFSDLSVRQTVERLLSSCSIKRTHVSICTKLIQKLKSQKILSKRERRLKSLSSWWDID